MPTTVVKSAPMTSTKASRRSVRSRLFSWKTSKTWVSTEGIGSPTTKMMRPFEFSVCSVACPSPTILMVFWETSRVEALFERASHSLCVWTRTFEAVAVLIELSRLESSVGDEYRVLRTNAALT